MYAFTVNTPAEAWSIAKTHIALHGNLVITEDRQVTRELRNLTLEINHPLKGFPIKGSGWEMTALDIYAAQFNDPDKGTFVYTYGERLNKDNQIQYIIDSLKKNHSTRRAVAKTWIPEIDHHEQHVPCLQLVELLIRDNKLYMTAVFRSHDIGRAYVSNVYGLGTLQARIAKEVGVGIGSLTTHSISAHIYEE
jgi:thymidylate synthase